MRSRHRSRKPNKRRSPLRRIWTWLWRLTLLLVVVAVAAVTLLRFVDPPTTAFVLHARLTAWMTGDELAVDQRWIDDTCVADALRVAVIAAEDQKFPAHWGFDVTQIVDALEEAGEGGGLRGASTLTQQTMKNLFLWPGQNWFRKGLEAGLTVLAEAIWPKRRILEVYLNVAEFGPGIYGAEAAARRYFGKPAAGLTRSESALLAAVLPSPRRLHVDAPSTYLRERQRWILRQMSQVAGLPGVQPLVRQYSATRCSRAVRSHSLFDGSELG